MSFHPGILIMPVLLLFIVFCGVIAAVMACVDKLRSVINNTRNQDNTNLEQSVKRTSRLAFFSNLSTLSLFRTTSLSGNSQENIDNVHTTSVLPTIMNQRPATAQSLYSAHGSIKRPESTYSPYNEKIYSADIGYQAPSRGASPDPSTGGSGQEKALRGSMSRLAALRRSVFSALSRNTLPLPPRSASALSATSSFEISTAQDYPYMYGKDKNPANLTPDFSRRRAPSPLRNVTYTGTPTVFVVGDESDTESDSAHSDASGVPSVIQFPKPAATRCLSAPRRPLSLPPASASAPPTFAPAIVPAIASTIAPAIAIAPATVSATAPATSAPAGQAALVAASPAVWFAPPGKFTASLLAPIKDNLDCSARSARTSRSSFFQARQYEETEFQSHV